MSNRMSGLHEFGAYRLDTGKRLLTRNGEVVMLAPKTFDLLLLLVESQGRALSKKELMDALWPDTFVEEANLTFQISTLRKALGEEATGWIETVPKHGYRFTAAAAEVHEASRRPARRREVLAGVLAVAIATSLFLWYKLRAPSVELAGVGGTLPAVPLTTYPGFELNPSLSPDGSQVAFSWNGPHEDNFDIYVKLVGPGEPVRLTTDPEQDEKPAWSPDGRSIAFLRRTAEGTAGIFLIPALGGAAERKLTDIQGLFRVGEPAGNLTIGLPAGNLAWTPDSKWLAAGGRFAESEAPGLWLISVDTARRRRLTTAPSDWSGDGGPAFSPDGRFLAFVRASTLSVTDIYVLALTSEFAPQGAPRRLTYEQRLLDAPCWTPNGREVVFSSGFHLGTRSLKSIPMDATSGGTTLLPAGEQATTLSISRHGRLVYARPVRDTNIWKLDLPRLHAAAAKPVRFISSTRDDHNPDYSPDGSKIAFASTRSGNEEIWVASGDGSRPVQMTSFGGPAAQNPRWSPDGRTILFKSRKEGSSDLYLLDPATAAVRRLTDHPASEIEPAWSRDGRWIYFGSNRTGRTEIWKMPAAGGPATQITKNGGQTAVESPDGKWIFYSKGTASPTTIWKAPAWGGEEVPVVGDLSYSLNFVLADQGIYFVALHGASDRTSIDFYSFATAKTTSLLRLDKPWWYGMAISPDQRAILYSVVDHAGSDLMLLDGYR
jgi:Tol biopolymer transport system component/DNA-binding winged helix-turn-helix (wHTH) protein